ncbi:hypothetical protein [Streptomyces sp. H27-D2]|uniref:hypothetical protein n=1 Tax=Streptomyces sp. H27-D2 TaxID=3046304 RepID=UPI002DBED985|nr:hypothetical protein [Streptomyces sp. H27-D2]MEC4020216.1 hypothetical protein [Streptomyces sp. H27-D2]
MAEGATSEGAMLIPENLPQRFSQFAEMSTILADLRRINDNINLQNKTAAGQDDEYAKEYHKFVEKRGKGLSTGLDGLSELLDMVGVNGKAASDGLDEAEDDASKIAAGPNAGH